MPIRNWTAVFLIFLILAVTTSGCLGTRTPVTASPPLPTVLLDYHRTGGIAGVDDRIVIFNNGAALIATRAGNHAFQVNQSEIERIDRIFKQAGFDALEETYTSQSGGADFMRYSITYQNKTVITEDTTIPYTLQSVIRELNALLGAGSNQDPMSGSLAGILP